MEVMCEVCSVSVSKYKCPSCRILYCSVDCWKSHKISSCSPKEQKEEISLPVGSKEEINFPTEDTVPLEKLQLLGQSKELQNILCNPHVRDILSAIDNSTNPAAAMQAAMLEPIFVEFADKCLEIVEPVSQKK